FAVDLHFGARPFAEQHAVAGLHVDRHELAVLVAGARADGDDLAFLRLFLCGVGNDDASRGLRFPLDAADQHAVMEWPELHGTTSWNGYGPTGARLLALSVDECQRANGTEGFFQVAIEGFWQQSRCLAAKPF